MTTTNPTSFTGGPRVLCITQDAPLVRDGHIYLDTDFNLSAACTEVHVLELRIGARHSVSSERVGKTAWVHVISAPTILQTLWAVWRLVRQELMFQGEFRADLVLARDPYVSALCASLIARYYDVPSQLHIPAVSTDARTGRIETAGWWQEHVVQFMVSRFQSIRTESLAANAAVRARYRVRDSAVLPRYQAPLEQTVSPYPLADTYQPIETFLLYHGELTVDSELDQVLRAAREYLRQPTIGLVVLGDGPHKAQFVAQAKELGISEQVIFVGAVTDPLPYLRAADVLIVPETSRAVDVTIYQAVAMDTALIMAESVTRNAVFVHQHSAFMYDPKTPAVIASGIEFMLAHPDWRQHCAVTAKQSVRARHYTDHAAFQAAYAAALRVDEKRASNEMHNK